MPRKTTPVAVALAVPCPKCHAAAGQRCKNYRGQNKQTCPERGRPAFVLVPDPIKPRQLELFA